MDPITIPEDLSELDDSQIADLYVALAERVEALEADEPSEENTSELERLADAADRLAAERDARDEAEATRLARRENALSRFRGDEDDPDAVEDPEAEADPEVGEPETEPETEAEVTAELGEPVAATVEAPAAAAVTPRRRGNVASLARRAGREVKPRIGGGEDRPTLKATAFAPRVKEGTEFRSTLELGEAIATAHKSWRDHTGAAQFVPIASGAKIMGGGEIGGDAYENFSVLQRLREVAAHGEDALVASGEFCTPQTPIYDFFRVSEAQTPIEEDLTTLQAPRGGIRFIQPPDTAAAAALAISVLDEADIDPDDPETWKNCTRVDCPTPDEEFVVGVSQCVTFSNLQYKTFGEQVAAFLEDVAVAFASRKEVLYLDAIDGGSTAVSGIDTGYGAVRQHLFNLEVAATGYRKRRGMKMDAPLKVYEPNWLLSKLAIDAVLDPENGIMTMNNARQYVLDAYKAMALTPVWYNDSATGRGQKWANAQTAGALNPFPNVSQSYLFAPGTWARLDGGSFDAGLVRDSTLNRTNDVQLFMEEWLGMAMLGLESVRLIDDLCANGAVPPAASALLACS